MRVYRRDEFMKLPEGTLYAKGKPWHFGELSVKGETWETDFTLRSLVNIESEDSGQWADRLFAMLDGGANYPLDPDYGRDGCFDKDDLFLVYEKADLEELQRVIAGAIAIA